MTTAEATLTEEQISVLAVLATGVTGDVAARRLGISERTIRRCCARVREQLGVVSTTEAIVYAVKQGLL